MVRWHWTPQLLKNVLNTETAMQNEGNGRHLLLLLVIPMLVPIPRLSVTNPCSIFPCLGRAEMGGGVHHKDVTLWWPEPYCAAEQRIVSHGAPIVDKSLLSYVALPTRQTWKRWFWQGFAIGTFVLYSPFQIPSNIFALLVCRIHTNKSNQKRYLRFSDGGSLVPTLTKQLHHV